MLTDSFRNTERNKNRIAGVEKVLKEGSDWAIRMVEDEIEFYQELGYSKRKAMIGTAISLNIR